MVLATGFRAVDHLHPLQITGVGGRSLTDIWKGGARALYGISLEDMPNFGILYGPNTNLAHNSLILQIETQGRDYIATLVSAVLGSKNEGKNLKIIPRIKVLKAYNEDLQRRLEKTSFADSRCTSWFKDKTGLITTNWFGTAIDYQKMMSVVRWSDFELTGPGTDKYKHGEQISLGRVVEETMISSWNLWLVNFSRLCGYFWDGDSSMNGLVLRSILEYDAWSRKEMRGKQTRRGRLDWRSRITGGDGFYRLWVH